MLAYRYTVYVCSRFSDVLVLRLVLKRMMSFLDGHVVGLCVDLFAC